MRRSPFDALSTAALGLAVAVPLILVLAQLSFTSLANPLRALLDPEVRGALWLSFGCAAAAAALGLVVAIPAAYALSRRTFWGKGVVDALLDVPLILSPIVIGISLILIFRSTPGRWIEDHVTRFMFEVPGILAAQFILALALQVRVLKAAFDGADRRLEQVARVLGCTPWRAFIRVSFPLARPAVMAALVLGFCRALGDFGATVTIAGAVRGKTETAPVAIYLSLSSVQIERAVSLSLALTIVALVVLLIARVGIGARR